MSTDAANHGERKTSGSPDLDRCHVIYGPGALRQTDYLVPYTSSYADRGGRGLGEEERER
jgi:hypothetical protein